MLYPLSYEGLADLPMLRAASERPDDRAWSEAAYYLAPPMCVHQ
jgi:hypothetical protein